MGSYTPLTKKSEKFESGKWSDIQEPPLKYFVNYAVVFHKDHFYYFGGYNDDIGPLSSILRLNTGSWTWQPVGELISARSAHGVISIGNTLMVIANDSLEKDKEHFQTKPAL